MAERYVCKNNGSVRLPITDGVYETDGISLDHETGTLTVAFYDVDGNIVTPSAGVVDHAMESTTDGQWFGASSGDSPIDATACGANAAYTIPVYNGPAQKGRIEFTGIAGASISYAVATFWRK